jgi:hypothetical protein
MPHAVGHFLTMQLSKRRKLNIKFQLQMTQDLDIYISIPNGMRSENEGDHAVQHSLTGEVPAIQKVIKEEIGNYISNANGTRSKNEGDHAVEDFFDSGSRSSLIVKIIFQMQLARDQKMKGIMR